MNHADAEGGAGAVLLVGVDVVMVLPFENTSNRPEYNWVGESFADSLAELLNKPGLLVVSSDEREQRHERRIGEKQECHGCRGSMPEGDEEEG